MKEYEKGLIDFALAILLTICTLSAIFDFCFFGRSVVEVAKVTAVGAALFSIEFVLSCFAFPERGPKKREFSRELAGNDNWSSLVAIMSIKEELKYRGPLYILLVCLQLSNLEIPVLAWVFIVICDGLWFSYAHFKWDNRFSQLFYHFLGGILFCWLLLASGSLIPSVFCHIVFNIIAIRLSYVRKNNS